MLINIQFCLEIEDGMPDAVVIASVTKQFREIVAACESATTVEALRKNLETLSVPLIEGTTRNQ